MHSLEDGAAQGAHPNAAAMGPPQPGTTLFSQWAASAMSAPTGAWNQPAGAWAPPAGQIASMQPAWKLKVIRCLDKKIRAYQPGYAPEDEDEEKAAEDGDGWSVKVIHGTVKKGKKGKSILRPAKRDFTADASFENWISSDGGATATE